MDGTLSETEEVVEDPDDDSVVTETKDRRWRSASSARARRSLERAGDGQLRAQGGEHEGPVRMVGGKTIEGHLQDGDLVGVDIPRHCSSKPRSLASTAATSRSVSSRSAARASSVEEGAAKGGVPGLALGGAEPDGQVDAERRIGVAELGVEVKGLGVVSQGVGGGESG